MIQLEQYFYLLISSISSVVSLLILSFVTGLNHEDEDTVFGSQIILTASNYREII